MSWVLANLPTIAGHLLAHLLQAVPAIIAEYLGIPQLTHLRKLTVEGDKITGFVDLALEVPAHGDLFVALDPPSPDTVALDLAAEDPAVLAALGYAAQYRGVRVTPGEPKELVKSPERLDAAQARIEREIGQVDQEVDHDEDEGDQHQIGDHHRPVERLDGVDDQLADAGPGEDGLGEHRAAEQTASGRTWPVRRYSPPAAASARAWPAFHTG